MESTFVKNVEPLRVGDRVVLFAPPGTRPSYRLEHYINPYVRFSEDGGEVDMEADSSSWSIVAGTVRAFGDEQMGNRSDEAVNRTFGSQHLPVPTRYDSIRICLIEWDGLGSNTFIAAPLDADIWKWEDFEKYRTHFDEKKALGAGFKTEELDKVILPETTRKSIVSVLKQHQHSNKIFVTWGLGEVIEYGKGMGMLFWGPPGTGKTWAAICIARAMNKQVKIIDSAQLQSSEPGGFERALQGVFAEAKKKKEVLFIDECDSLVQDRKGMGQILSAETNCLLKEVENFDGILILATNRVSELDKALERRISLVVEFPNPNAEQREAIWKRMLPSKMPLAEDVDVKVLATEFEISGGFIKNAVLGAARLAVTEDSEVVKMEHFVHALGQIKSSNKAFAQKSSILRGLLQKGMQGGGLGKTVDRGVEKEMEIDEDKVLNEVAPMPAASTKKPKTKATPTQV